MVVCCFNYKLVVLGCSVRAERSLRGGEEGVSSGDLLGAAACELSYFHRGRCWKRKGDGKGHGLPRAGTFGL